MKTECKINNSFKTSGTEPIAICRDARKRRVNEERKDKTRCYAPEEHEEHHILGTSPPKKLCYSSQTVKSSNFYVKEPSPCWPRGKIPPQTIYITGYKRTGKDTFGNDVRNGVFRYPWSLYGKSRDKDPTISFRMSSEDKEYFKKSSKSEAERIFKSFVGAETTAFADELRRIVSNTLSLDAFFDFETNKDTKKIDGKLVRQHLIDAVSEGRAIDPAYWTKRAFLKFFEEAGREAKRVVCTDWRFINELKSAIDAGMSITTVRLYRSIVPVPPENIESEHDLDSIDTDYLLVPDKHNFKEACKNWEFYSGYVLLGSIVDSVFKFTQ